MKGYLEKVNEKSERLSEYCIKYSVLGFTTYLVITAALNVLYCYLKNGCLSTNCLYYPGKYTYVNYIFVK